MFLNKISITTVVVTLSVLGTASSAWGVRGFSVDIGPEGKSVESFKTVGEEKRIYVKFNGNVEGEKNRLTAIKEQFENNTNEKGESYITFDQKEVTKCLSMTYDPVEFLCGFGATYVKERPTNKPIATARIVVEPGECPNMVTLHA
jgi:hypothetical protein